jgi:aryl-alcohol dehydrogenase-like predicted oxidoreductase
MSVGLDEISSLGFGLYRVSHRSPVHRKALLKAVNSGVNLVDTSSNYTDGDSETLVGMITQDFPREKLFVISKAGYIQGQIFKALSELSDKEEMQSQVLDLGQDLKHCIHPDFLAHQLECSLARMGTDHLDAFLLHNPEYFFDTKDPDRTTYYDRLEKAFEFLEEKVQEGKIRYYGVSSNTLPLPDSVANSTSFDLLIERAQKVAKSHHLKFLQFPFNLAEREAEVCVNQGPSLIEKCRSHQIKSLGNRPLNAFYGNQLLRLATYSPQELSSQEEQEIFEICMNLLERKWIEQGEEKEALYQVPLMKQFCEIWNTLTSPDAVDQVFQMHFFPFLAHIWGGKGVPPDQAKPFFVLYDTAIYLSRQKMSARADQFFKGCQERGELEIEEGDCYPAVAINSYLKKGIDHVLVGMRRPEYVDSLQHLFLRPRS